VDFFVFFIVSDYTILIYKRKEINNMKKCRICGLDKELKDFHKKKSSRDGYRNECKECVKDIQKKYKEDPTFIEKRKQYDKKRYDENREEILEYKKQYHEDNKEKINAKKRQYYANDKVKNEHNAWMRDYQKDPKNKEVVYRYRNNNPHVIAWRSILYRTLNQFGKEKQFSTQESLGYSADELKSHIETLFTEGMSWDNHGEWEIDHIFPLSKFDPETPVNIVNSLQNLQPLWKEENRSKSNNQ
jgi:hypothetical protein